MKLNLEIEFLLKNAKISLTKEEYFSFENDLKKFKQNLEIINHFDYSNSTDAVIPFDNITTTYLRSDDIVENNSTNVLKQASNSDGEYILLLKDKK